jgi:hypothetical protein
MVKLLLPITFPDAMPSLSLQRLFLSAILAAACSGALAQYSWLDSRGVKQYSDMPPPSDVPASRILKAPGGRSAQAAGAADSPAAAPSLAEREADFRKRRAQAQESEREAEERRRRYAEFARNCEQARNYARALDSGQRIGRLDAGGERQYLDDGQKAREVADVQRILAACRQ